MSGLLRTRTGHEARVGTVELFFDLVFVFAITQLSHHLLQTPTLTGALGTLLLFLGIWWAWIFTSWVTNWLDPERWQVRMMLFVLMGCGLVIAMAIPQAWGPRGLVFGVTFALTQVGRSLFTMLAVRRHNRANYRNFQRISVWFCVSGVLWIYGGLVDGALRLPLWAAALGVEYLGPLAAFRVPGLGRSRTADWDVEGGHLAERCGLFIIIALGESVVITGSTAAALLWTGPVLAAFASAFLGSVAMWWIYFNIGADRASRLIVHHDDPGRVARLAYTYGHIPIIAGIIVSAASDEMLLAHPTGPAAPAAHALTLGGAALFLAGNLFFKRVTWRHVPLSHLVGLALLAALAFVPFPHGFQLGLATAASLIIVACWETASLGGRGAGEPA
ncbi:MAG TPA: low temperature requirement protein A [Sphingobium sp.]|nr:low temperature requirement protein A [Sphingobium sp.]